LLKIGFSPITPANLNESG